ncbi:MAG: LCP family protein [Solirubrobacterales bacterium]|nr:LCP family protein [Solirubrobacterales bacterium]
MSEDEGTGEDEDGEEKDFLADDDGSDDELNSLGLTAEFARLEAEIEKEARKLRNFRGEETGSSETVEPAGQQARAPDPETDLEGGEADPPEAPLPPEHPVPDPGEDDADVTPPPESDEAVHDGVPDAPTTPPPPANPPASEHTVIQPRSSAPVPIAAGGYPSAGYTDEDIEDKTPALWWRFMTGSVMIVLSITTAVAVTSLLKFNDFAKSIQPIPGIEDRIVQIDPGEPQTILIVGSDERSNTPGDPGRSDTTMLLRVDADNEVLSLFSLPRDLKVDIAGNNFGEGRLNEAFTDGGVKKTLVTVQNLTGLDINHVVNVDFQGFADAVDAIGCVYVDVDRDYFNDNSQALSSADEYAVIDVNAGYQRRCGLNALDYVRYRHTDSDFARAARQQDFLRNARAQVPVKKVLPIIGGDTGNDLLDIFTKYTSSDVRNPADVISVLKAFIGVRDVPIKEVHFNATDSIENGVAYVTASDEQIQKAVDEFLGEEDTAGGPADGSAADKAKKAKRGNKDKKEKQKHSDSGSADVISAEDASAVCGGIDKFAAFGRTSARRLKFPVYVPTSVVPGSCYDEGSRQYDIKDNEDDKQPAYKMVIALNSPTIVNEYYGIQGTTWDDPPILEEPSETREIDGRNYDLFYDGDRLRLVAFHEEGNAYWISNTLLQSLDEDQMLAIATSMDEAHG